MNDSDSHKNNYELCIIFKGVMVTGESNAVSENAILLWRHDTQCCYAERHLC
jgi:hypothetical protein